MKSVTASKQINKKIFKMGEKRRQSKSSAEEVVEEEVEAP
jgi:hypothetical protein